VSPKWSTVSFEYHLRKCGLVWMPLNTLFAFYVCQDILFVLPTAEKKIMYLLPSSASV